MEAGSGQRSALLLLFTTLVHEVSSIGCFTCVSVRGNNTECEDPFHSSLPTQTFKGSTMSNYLSQCWSTRKHRNGLFPADHCIKIIGVGSNANDTITVRTCALDSGSLTADTEIVRISHCGHFQFQNKHYSGCVQSCDTDGCNSSFLTSSYLSSLFLFPLISILYRSN